MTQEAKQQAPACERCRFFEVYHGSFGACRRYAPRLVDGMVPSSGIVDNPLRAVFPEVMGLMWCGEFAPRDREGT